MGQKSPRAGINSQQVFMVKCVGLVKVGGVLREWLNNEKKKMNGCRNGLNNRVRTELCYRLPLGGSTWLQKDRNSELLKEMFIICVFLQFLQPYRCCVHLNGLRPGQ